MVAATDPPHSVCSLNGGPRKASAALRGRRSNGRSSMRSCICLLAAALSVAISALVPAAAPVPVESALQPTIIVRVKPIDELLADVKTAAKTIVKIALLLAPSASRMPMSRVRSLTMYEITP